MLQSNVKEKVQSVLDDSSIGELAKWKAISKYLLEEKILYKQCIKADQLLVHPQNRGGTGVQVFNLHAKGKRILECGCDTSLLVGSTCVEMSPDQAKRAEQARLTQSIHAQYPDFIAPYSGHERFLTVSSSHVSQFFKAMMLGCKSPEESLVGPKTGKMSMASINDIDFLQACNDGWTWTVIPFYVEEPCFDI